MRSKEAFAYSRSTGYFCSVATDHPAPCRRVTPRRAGACHDATGMKLHDKDGLQRCFEAVATWLSVNALGDITHPPIFKAMVFGIRLSIGTVGEQADNLEATARAVAYQDCHEHCKLPARAACPLSASAAWLGEP